MPRTRKLIVALQPEPSRLNMRIETELLTIMKSSTESLPLRIWCIPPTDRLLPSLPLARTEIALLSAKESKMESLPVRREISTTYKPDTSLVHLPIERAKPRAAASKTF
jgi:hypothetical protein